MNTDATYSVRTFSFPLLHAPYKTKRNYYKWRLLLYYAEVKNNSKLSSQIHSCSSTLKSTNAAVNHKAEESRKRGSNQTSTLFDHPQIQQWHSADPNLGNITALFHTSTAVSRQGYYTVTRALHTLSRLHSIGYKDPKWEKYSGGLTEFDTPPSL